MNPASSRPKRRSYQKSGGYTLKRPCRCSTLPSRSIAPGRTHHEWREALIVATSAAGIEQPPNSQHAVP